MHVKTRVHTLLTAVGCTQQTLAGSTTFAAYISILAYKVIHPKVHFCCLVEILSSLPLQGFSWLKMQLFLSFPRQAQHKGLIDYSCLSEGRYQEEFCLPCRLQCIKDLRCYHFQHSGSQGCRKPGLVILIFNSLLLHLIHFSHWQK